MRRRSILLLCTIATIIYCSCKKDAPAATLIIGNWKCSTSIRKTILIDNVSNTNPPVIKSDTTFCIPGITYINLDIFAGDTLNITLVYKLNTPYSSIFEIKKDVYTVKDNKLYCNQNPFSLNGDAATISLLTATNLVLYDKDTTNYQPLVINEQWTNFYK